MTLVWWCFLNLIPVMDWIATSLVAQTVKSLPTMRETRVQSLGWEGLLEKEMATHSSILPGKSQGWRSLVGYSPWGRKESDTTERLNWTQLNDWNFHFQTRMGIYKTICIYIHTEMHSHIPTYSNVISFILFYAHCAKKNMASFMCISLCVFDLLLYSFHHI